MIGGQTRLIVGIDVDVMDKLMETVRHAKNDKDDANMVYASAWKQLKDRGANTAALKVAFKLRTLNDAKKAQVFIRDMLEYCAYFGIWDQMELPLQMPAAAANDEGPNMRLSEGEDEPRDDDLDDADDVGPVIGAVGGERVDAAAVGADEIPANAGALFNDGAEAALAGVDRDAHAFDDGSPEAEMYLQGYDSVPATDNAAAGEKPAFLQ